MLDEALTAGWIKARQSNGDDPDGPPSEVRFHARL
jgi:hypothetical protein